jgi:hypothetical protein
MKEKRVQILLSLAAFAILFAASAPAATPMPPTATLRPSDTPVPPTASPRPIPVSLIETGQRLNKLAGVGVALGDLNKDGNLDAFVVNQQNSPDGDGYRIYLGDGRGRFTDSGQSLIGSDFGTPAIGDINADGRLEAITGSTVWLNDGQGNFEAHPELIEGVTPGQLSLVKLADLNGDGSLDIFAILQYGAMRVYFNDGQGHFRDSGQKIGDGTIGSGQVALIALGDINGDHSIDAVTAGWRWDGSVPCPNRVWLNDGHGTFSDSGQLLDEGASHVHGLALGDLNGDGHLDLVMGIQDQYRNGRIYLNDGQGRFIGSEDLGGVLANNIALGDFDGDGSLDVFLTGSGQPNALWLNDGTARFRDSGLRIGDPGIWSWDVAVGDFNGDGKTDAFVVACLAADTTRGSPAQVWLNTTPA